MAQSPVQMISQEPEQTGLLSIETLFSRARQAARAAVSGVVHQEVRRQAQRSARAALRQAAHPPVQVVALLPARPAVTRLQVL